MVGEEREGVRGGRREGRKRRERQRVENMTKKEVGRQQGDGDKDMKENRWDSRVRMGEERRKE